MPYPIPPNAIVEVTYRYDVDGQANLNTYFYKYVNDNTVIGDGAGFLAGWSSVLGDKEISGQLANIMVNLTPVTVAHRWVQTQMIFPIRYALQRVAINQSGAVNGTTQPVGVAVSITRRTQLAQKGRVGRIQLGGVFRDYVANSVLTAAGTTAYSPMRAWCTASRFPLSGPAEPREMQPVLFNRTAPSASQPISSATIQPEARFMTRRTVGRGI